MSGFDASNPVFRQYAVSAAILAIKLISMAPLTARHRFSKKVFANPEDFGPKNVKLNDSDVERVRRAHLNDLENIPIYLVLGLLFVLTEPSAFTAKICYYGFAAARIGHTISYLNELQPFRAIFWFMGTLINVFMAINLIRTFF